MVPLPRAAHLHQDALQHSHAQPRPQPTYLHVLAQAHGGDAAGDAVVGACSREARDACMGVGARRGRRASPVDSEPPLPLFRHTAAVLERPTMTEHRGGTDQTCCASCRRTRTGWRRCRWTPWRRSCMGGGTGTARGEDERTRWFKRAGGGAQGGRRRTRCLCQARCPLRRQPARLPTA